MKTREFRKCSGWPSNFGGHLIPGDHLIQASYRVCQSFRRLPVPPWLTRSPAWPFRFLGGSNAMTNALLVHAECKSFIASALNFSELYPPTTTGGAGRPSIRLRATLITSGPQLCPSCCRDISCVFPLIMVILRRCSRGTNLLDVRKLGKFSFTSRLPNILASISK